MRGWALVVTLLVLLLAGCGIVRVAVRAAGGASPEPTVWGLYGPGGPQLVSVREEDSGRLLAIGAQLPTGQQGCMRDLTASLTEFDPTAAYLTIEFRSRLASVFGACLTRVLTVYVKLPAPLGKRQVQINAFDYFAPGNGTLLRHCAYFGCGPFRPPPPASCTQSSYQWAMLSTAPANDPVYQLQGCDGHWLVLDVGWPGGAAGCDGPSCTPDLVSTRWFFRASAHGWVTISSSHTAGCGRVRQVVPTFPTRLCATLPAP
jgi:hypothetical protein